MSIIPQAQKHQLLPRWPDQPAIYDINKSYLENAEEGPFFHGTIPKRPYRDEKLWQDLFGYKVASPIGVPAGPLLNASWVELASLLGFDVLTYKTIRSSSHPGHPLPNMLFVDAPEQLDPQSLPSHVSTSGSPPSNIEALAVTNSFGMPSRTRGYLAQDIPKAQSLLKPGQVMIVSVVATPQPGEGTLGFKRDFVTVSRQAVDYGAKIIEANFSCPNVSSGSGLYLNSVQVFDIASSIVDAIGDIPLIVKVGTFEHLSQLRDTLIAIARAGARGICGINTISMQVHDHAGNPALGQLREKSGICGSPIRQAALNFIKAARKIIDSEGLDLSLLATGGAVLPQHFQEMLDAGASVAMSGAGMMWDPYLAMRFHEDMYDR